MEIQAIESILNSLKPQEPNFSAFTIHSDLSDNKPANASNNLLNYFNVNNICVQDKIIKLDDMHLSAGVEYLYKCSSKELITFKDKKFIKKLTVEKDECVRHNVHLVHLDALPPIFITKIGFFLPNSAN